MVNNPGKTMTIYDIPEMVRQALPLSATPNNITAGFKVSGICPFNPLIFTDIDFMPSYVTDRPLNSEIEIQPDPITYEHNQLPDTMPSISKQLDTIKNLEPNSPIPEQVEQNILLRPAEASTSNNNFHDTIQQIPILHIPCPEDIRPFPKAGARKVGKQHPRKRCSAILTDTPEKDKLEERKRCQVKKTYNEKKVKRKLFPKNKEKQTTKIKKSKRKSMSSSSDDEDTQFLVCCELCSSSRPKEKWVACMKCKNWSHEDCTNGDKCYICHHCESDNETFSDE